MLQSPVRMEFSTTENRGNKKDSKNSKMTEDVNAFTERKYYFL